MTKNGEHVTLWPILLPQNLNNVVSRRNDKRVRTGNQGSASYAGPSNHCLRFAKSCLTTMALDLQKFARDYHRSLVGLLDAIPRACRKVVPPCISQTAFVIAVADTTGRYSVELLGRDRHETIKINGTEAFPASEFEPGFIVGTPTCCLESVVFQGTTDGSEVTWRLNGHLVIHGLSFASTEFIAHHKPEGFHAQFVGGEVPFRVEAEGVLLAVDVVNGYVVNGEPQVKVIEWLKILGSETLIPLSDVGIRELAIVDLASMTLKLPEPASNLRFDEFLRSLKGPVDHNVLLLGSYRTESRFDEARAALEALGYAPFLLKDSPDLPIQCNIEKLFAAVMFSSFVLILDDHPSGHLAELATLLPLRLRPMIIVRHIPEPTTAFLEDSVRTNDSCQVQVLETITAASLTPAVQWARGWLTSQEVNLNTINTWRA